MPKYTIRRIILLTICAAILLGIFQNQLRTWDWQSFFFLPQFILTLLGFLDQRMLREPRDAFSFFTGLITLGVCLFVGSIWIGNVFMYFWRGTHPDAPKKEVEKLVLKHGDKFQILEISGEVTIVKLP